MLNWQLRYDACIQGINRMYNSSLFLIAAAKRRERGISLDQIASATKISIRSLKAIEEGDFRKLPGGIYNTSYIRQYARAIEYDEGALLAFYTREMACSDAAARSSSRSSAVQSETSSNAPSSAEAS